LVLVREMVNLSLFKQYQCMRVMQVAVLREAVRVATQGNKVIDENVKLCVNGNKHQMQ